MARRIVIEVPEEVVATAKVPEEEFEQMVKVELAVALYRRGILSFGQARRLANLSKWEFIEELAKRGIERHYTLEEFEEDAWFGRGEF